MDFAEFAAGKTLTPAQEECIQHLDGPLLISAGAGSGKTFTLTQRVVWALLPGSGKNGASFLGNVDEMLVITFTERAAAEIKERVRSALREAGLFEEALKVDGAWVSTIHGACTRILREHALEVGLDPSFSVLGEVQEQQVRATAIQQVLAEVDGLEESPYQLMFDALGPEKVRDAVAKILGLGAHLPSKLEGMCFEPQPQPLSDKVARLRESLENLPDAATEANRNAAADILVALGQIPGAPEEAPEALADALRGKAGKFGKAEVADIKVQINEISVQLQFAPFAGFSQLMHELACKADARYQAALAQEGAVDMAGLIRNTLAVFQDYPDIAKSYQDRFRLVMVDEFQDTSQLQVDLIMALVGGDLDKLCTVGDAQQSIYRFQGAEVSVYLQHKREMAGVGAKVVQLDDNFRSHPDILAFVRRVCGQDNYFLEPFLDLQARGQGKPYAGSAPRVEVVLNHHAHKQRGIAAWWEAEHIAQRFAKLREEGHSPSEMVVLLGRLSKASYFATALRNHGFSCVVTGGSKYYEAPHVQVCLQLLAVLANPYNSESLLSLLTSEMLPVTSADLLSLATRYSDQLGLPVRQNPAKGLTERTQPLLSPSPLLEHARSVLEAAWAKLGRVRPSQLVEDTILESGWLSRLEAGDANDQAKAADVLKFLRLVHDAEQEAGYDMAQVAAAMQQAAASTREKPGSLAVENLDAVRIMTIHSSKGLEFPIVAVAECCMGSEHEDSLRSCTDGPVTYLSYAEKVKKQESTAPIAQAQDAAEFRARVVGLNQQREHEERMRLFYVAATRASAALIVSLSGRWAESRKAYLPATEQILCGLFGGSPVPEESASVDYGGSEPAVFTRICVPEGATLQQDATDGKREVGLPQLAPKRRPRLEPVRMQADFCSYSSLAKQREGEPEDNSVGEAVDAGVVAPTLSEEAQHVQDGHDRDKATVFGSALHRACEWLCHQDAEPSEAQVEERLAWDAASFGVRDADRLSRAFERWRHSEARIWASGFNSVRAEVPFVVALDGRNLEGEIDLLGTTGPRAGVVDYKTGGSPEETPEQLQAKHLLQAQCYAYALLSSGFEDVELRFVRVEQEDVANPDQPQVVCYSFSAGDADALRAAIAQ